MWKDDVGAEIAELFSPVEGLEMNDLGVTGALGQEARGDHLLAGIMVYGNRELRWADKKTTEHGRSGKLDGLADAWLAAQESPEELAKVTAKIAAVQTAKVLDSSLNVNRRRAVGNGLSRNRPVGGEQRRPDLHGEAFPEAQVRALFRVGVPAAEIARRIGSTKMRVLRLLSGATKNVAKGSELFARDEKVLALVAELPEASMRVLAEQLAMTKDEIRTSLRRLGLAKVRAKKGEAA